MTILPLWAGETKSGPRVCSLHAKGPCRPFICRVREKGRSFTHNASPDRAWRTPHHTQQTRDDPGTAENQIAGRLPGRVLAARAVAPVVQARVAVQYLTRLFPHP